MDFTISPIPDKIADNMIATGLWKETCPVALDELSLVTALHLDFNKNLKTGQMITNGKLAVNVVSIFKELLAVNFPIAKMELLDKYHGSDELSMEDNNTSCFNYRKIAGTDRLSVHSYGLAIDINPVQNPCIVRGLSYPGRGKEFIDRSLYRSGMVENIVHIFAKYGFSNWGGAWSEPIDYHHFQFKS